MLLLLLLLLLHLYASGRAQLCTARLQGHEEAAGRSSCLNGAMVGLCCNAACYLIYPEGLGRGARAASIRIR